MRSSSPLFAFVLTAASIAACSEPVAQPTPAIPEPAPAEEGPAAPEPATREGLVVGDVGKPVSIHIAPLGTTKITGVVRDKLEPENLDFER